ncbi:lysophospholipid acyltransferase family protein [Candidatus Latescibacterota bacterium]
MKKKSTTKRIMYYVEFILLKLLSLVFTILPLSMVYFIVKMLGLFAFHVLRIRRDVSIDNIRKSFGDVYSEKKIRKIASDSYVNIGITILEMLIVQRFQAQMLERVDMTDSQILRQNVDKGRGVIVVSCHFGSWEIVGAALSAADMPMTVVVKKLSNPYVDKMIYDRRTGFGNKIINHGASVKHIVGALKNNEIVGLISDQDAGGDGVFVDFFDRKASTPRGAAQLALKYNVPIVVVMTLRTGNGRYRGLFNEITVDENDTVETVTQRYTTSIEHVIREHPEQYFWMHRRWKTQEPRA